MTDALSSEVERLRRRGWLLEKLLTSAAAPRPPGAARAVALLPRPSISVILPTFNRARLVCDAIESVLAQTCEHWELIVVDDGSSDDTCETVAPYLSDPRIRYVRQDNAGCSAARNRGLAETSAPFVAYLDSDNVFYPDFLGRAVDLLATDPDADMLYGALATESHGLEHTCILLEPFDRARLLEGNFIDTGVIVHRRALADRLGGWDPSFGRLADWELALRYTAEKPARVLYALACHYRVSDDLRISDTVPYGPEYVSIRSRYFPASRPTRPPRVLYAVWHYPQLSETYIETELQQLRKWGIQIEVWREIVAVSPYPTDVKIHDGSLADAIAAFQPDILHVHWLSFAQSKAAILGESGLPVTVRLHGFDTTRESLTGWLKHNWAASVYAYPSQIGSLGIDDARLLPVPVAFDAEAFLPSAAKDPRLVVRTSAALPAKDLEMFLELAKRLPEHRFVLAVVTCQGCEDVVHSLQRRNEELQSPVQLLVDVQRAGIIDLVGRAAIYIHTMCPPGTANATSVGQPISVAEAMATGCYCLVRDQPELASLVADAGATYRDIDDIAAKIAATQAWSAAEWKATRSRAIERAFVHHAGSLALQSIYSDWVHLSSDPGAGARSAGGRPADASNAPRRPHASNGAVTTEPGSFAGIAAARLQTRQQLGAFRRKLVDAARDWDARFGASEGKLLALCRAHPEPALTVALLYHIVLGRPADPGGMLHYVQAAASGRALKRIAQDLLRSEEYRALQLGPDWWRTACANIGELEVAPRALQSPAAYCLSLAQRQIDATE
jgi:glycosyltransferase involved in cell wall biosynthesis